MAEKTRDTPTKEEKRLMATEEHNKTVVRRFYEGLNTRNLAVIDELIAPDFVDHSAPPGHLPGPQGMHQTVTMFLSAFPDLHWTIEDAVAEGNKVVLRLTARGTHRGAFQGIPPTGKQVTVTGLIISRLADGKIAEEWANRDVLGLLQQLGVVAVPGLGLVARMLIGQAKKLLSRARSTR
jgi:steroid delta-isomerase-like uncharacterized protein